jgi:hypothetical protein
MIEGALFVKCLLMIVQLTGHGIDSDMINHCYTNGSTWDYMMTNNYIQPEIKNITINESTQTNHEQKETQESNDEELRCWIPEGCPTRKKWVHP